MKNMDKVRALMQEFVAQTSQKDIREKLSSILDKVDSDYGLMMIVSHTLKAAAELQILYMVVNKTEILKPDDALQREMDRQTMLVCKVMLLALGE